MLETSSDIAPADSVEVPSEISSQEAVGRRKAITIKNTPERNREIPDVFVDDSRDSLLTYFGKATLKDRYLTENESYQDRFANCVRYYADNQAHAQRMYEYISLNWCLPATPILSNGGTTKGNLFSCFVNEVPDSMKGIIDTWKENSWLAAKGGGVGVYYGNVRGIGEKAGVNGKTSGAISFIKVDDSATACVSQGMNRRGSRAIYMPINHPEIEHFIDMRRPTGGDPDRKALNVHHGVCIDDAFYEAVESNGTYDLISPATGAVMETVNARSLWIKLLIARMETGEPYILNMGAVHKYTPEHHRKSGLYAKTSNLCVAPETKILTKEGEKPIKDLHGTWQTIWNGEEWTDAFVSKTATNEKLLKVNFSNDSFIWATPYHKFEIITEDGFKEVRTTELEPADKVLSVKYISNPGCEDCSVETTEVQVSSIEDLTRRDDTYCFNEPKKHMGVLNGILTGNCAEIVLPTGLDHHGIERTAICCLFQLNVEKWDEWKNDHKFINDVARFLDNVLQDYIDYAGPEFEKSRYSAHRERSIGVGIMGLHSFFQSKNIPLESAMAKSWNMRIFKHIRKHMDEASSELAEERGACPDAAEHGIMERFSYKMAIAPTASTSVICGGTSPGIDPIATNIYTQKTLDGSFEVKNRHLEKLLESKGRNTKEVWNSMLKNMGSVQHLDFLTQEEKDVFKTSFEIDQRWLIELAADRTPYVCQSQSLNLFIPPDVHKRDLHNIHMLAWKKGVKSLYYCRTYSLQRADNTDGGDTQVKRPYTPIDYSQCLACE